MTARSAFMDPKVQEYIVDTMVVDEHPALQALRKETASMPNAQMQIGSDQGQFMQLLARLLPAHRYLEIGVFTGYSSLAMALAMPPEGKIVACDVSEEYTAVARRYWREAGVEKKIDLQLGPALETLQRLAANGGTGLFDIAFIDADKTNVDNYYECALRLDSSERPHSHRQRALERRRRGRKRYGRRHQSASRDQRKSGKRRTCRRDAAVDRGRPADGSQTERLLIRVVSLNCNGIRSASRKGLYVGFRASIRTSFACRKPKRKSIRCPSTRSISRSISPSLPMPNAKVIAASAFTANGNPTGRSAGLRLAAVRRRRPVRRNRLRHACDRVALRAIGNDGSRAAALERRVFSIYFEAWLARALRDGKSHILCGDYNIAHREIDVYNPATAIRVTGFLPQERAWMERVLESGWIDAIRVKCVRRPGIYTWWSNFQQAFEKNRGLAHRLPARHTGSEDARRIRDAYVYREERFSDHAPVVVDYDLGRCEKEARRAFWIILGSDEEYSGALARDLHRRRSRGTVCGHSGQAALSALGLDRARAQPAPRYVRLGRRLLGRNAGQSARCRCSRRTQPSRRRSRTGTTSRSTSKARNTISGGHGFSGIARKRLLQHSAGPRARSSASI